MIASMQPADWDVLNSDQKYEICGKLLHFCALYLGSQLLYVLLEGLWMKERC